MKRRRFVFHILWSFSASFAIARLLVYFIDIKNTLPNVYLTLFGYHLHHFNLGILAIALAGYAAITELKIPKKYLAILFGAGLGLIVDELGLLLALEDDYWLRQTYDVAILLVAFVINIEYFSDFWLGIFKRLLRRAKKKEQELFRLKRFPEVSVVIPAYNEEKFIGKTLESLKNQDYQGHYEVIVVDNTSTDKTAQIAKSYGAKVVYEPQKGVHFARQTGFLNATGSLIASTDADDILPSDWLTKLIYKLQENKNAVAFGGWFRLEKGPFTSRFIINNLSKPVLNLYNFVFGKKVLVGQNFIVKKEAFFKTQGFMNFTPMFEDVQLAHRLQQVGNVIVDYSPYFSVTSSPRRWKNNFSWTVLPYLANGLAFGLFSKIAYKNFKDVRDEKPAPLFLRALPSAIGIFVFALLFTLVPASPAHAKIAPFTKRTSSKVIPATKAFGRKLNHAIYLKLPHGHQRYTK